MKLFRKVEKGRIGWPSLEGHQLPFHVAYWVASVPGGHFSISAGLSLSD